MEEKNRLQPDCKVVVAGLVKVGKTNVIRRLLKGRFERTNPTAGYDTKIFKYSKINLQVTDLSGYDIFIHTLWKAFIQKAEVLVYVVDASDHGSIVKSRDALQFALSCNTDLSMLIILANKQDLPSAFSKDDILRSFNLTNILSEHNIKQFHIFETSTKSGRGIIEAFDWMINQLTDQLIDCVIQQDEDKLAVEDDVIHRILDSFLEKTDDYSAFVSRVKREELPVIKKKKKSLIELLREREKMLIRNHYQKVNTDLLYKDKHIESNKDGREVTNPNYEK